MLFHKKEETFSSFHSMLCMKDPVSACGAAARNPGMVWVGRNPKAHLVPSLAIGRDPALSQVSPSPVLKGWGQSCAFTESREWGSLGW